MKDKTEAKITTIKTGMTDFTKISFKPDLKLFKLEGLDEDHVSLF